MDSALQELLDERAIRRVLALYAHGCDRCDGSLMASTYTRDSWDDHGHVKATGAEFSRYMTTELIPATCETLSHLLGQSLIELDGDEARAETYFIAVTRNEVEGKPMCNQLGGRYVDKLRREGEEWKIVGRVCVRDWSVSIPVEADSFINAQLTPGGRGPHDPGVALMGLAYQHH